MYWITVEEQTRLFLEHWGVMEEIDMRLWDIAAHDDGGNMSSFDMRDELWLCAVAQGYV